MKELLAVGFGGFIGAIARYGVTLAVARVWQRPFPLATFLINIVGSLLIGIVFAATARRVELDPIVRLFLATGILGAFTTFSAFELETQQLQQSGLTMTAVLYIVASVVCGLLAVYAGLAIGRR